MLWLHPLWLETICNNAISTCQYLCMLSRYSKFWTFRISFSSILHLSCSSIGNVSTQLPWISKNHTFPVHGFGCHLGPCIMRALERQPSPQRFVIDLAGSSMVATSASPPIPWAPLMGPFPATQGGHGRSLWVWSRCGRFMDNIQFIVITRITDIWFYPPTAEHNLCNRQLLPMWCASCANHLSHSAHIPRSGMSTGDAMLPPIKMPDNTWA